MAVRMTGMVSNMDTETLIKQMLDAQRLKNKRVTDKQTLLTWQQDKWKDLNAKLYKLYQEDLSKMRLQGNYLTKLITSSDENLVTATGTSDSPEGTHNLTVDKLASPQHVTGKQVTKTGADGKAISGSSKLVGDLGMTEGTQITIKTATGTKILDVDASTTVDMFLQKCKDAGLNASYDTAQKRFFISSKASGLKNQFTITTSTDDAIANKRVIDGLVNYKNLNSTDKNKVDAAYQVLKGADPAKLTAAFESTEISDSDDAATKAVKNAVATLNSFTETNVTNQALAIATSQIKDEMTEAIKNGTSYLGVDYAGVYEADTEKAKEELREKYKDPELDFTEEKYQKELDALVNSKVAARVKSGMTSGAAKELITSKQNEILADGTTYSTTDAEGVTTTTTIPSLSAVIGELKANIQAYAAGAVTATEGEMSNLGLTEIADVDGVITSGDPGIAFITASDSQITYNGAVLTGTTNTISVNGLTMTLKGLSEGKTVTLNVKKDTQKVYDMVKNFISSYNEILKEMNALYDAPSSRGYDPLSDDEKEAMTDDQIEKWENKIKDSILRRDSTLGSVINAMRTALSGTVQVGGKNYSLASYGIQTSTDYSEKGLLHIFGNKEDSVYSDREDKLMKALESDPDTVIKVLSGISKKLYDDMDDKMSSIPNVRTKYHFENDKLMDNQQREYKKRVAEQEAKLTEMENKYYKQFSAMETALSKLQSQTNALTSLFGTNS